MQFLEWMWSLVTVNDVARVWVLDRLNIWVEPYLLNCSLQKVRAGAMMLLIMLVPSASFRLYARAVQPTKKSVLENLRTQVNCSTQNGFHLLL